MISSYKSPIILISSYKSPIILLKVKKGNSMMIVCQPLVIMIKVKMRIVKMMRPSWLGLMKTGDALDKEVTGPTGLYCSLL